MRRHIVAVKLNGEELRKLEALAAQLSVTKSDILRFGLRNLAIGDEWRAQS